MAADDRLSAIEWQRLGAGEGTGFGLLAAGTVMGMAAIGEVFGGVAPFETWHYALVFLAFGLMILLWTMGRSRQE